jgi:serine/threonine protein kinase/Flp pilus assembly protein TadD
MSIDERILDLLDRRDTLRLQGQEIALEVLCRDCPHLLPEVRRQVRLQELRQRWEEQKAKGHLVTAEDLCHDCPELLAELKHTIQALEHWQQIAVAPEERIEELMQAWEESGRAVSARSLCQNSPHLRERLEQRMEEARAPFGPYHPVKILEAGGMGVVYLAQDQELQRDVALKQLKPNPWWREEDRQRFLWEAEITSRLDHPGIVPIYALFKGKRLGYVMRLIRGHNLGEAIAAYHNDRSASGDQGERIVALQKLLRSYLTACQTIAFAHSRGILHRDLKPANIMLGPYGETLVVDWGLAKSVNEPSGTGVAGTVVVPVVAHDLARTETGIVKGSPSYMSPEQAEGQPAGTAADVYALGATLYHILTGRAPFEGDVPAILDKVKRGDFIQPRAVKKDVPPPLEAICLKAMRRMPQDRYPTVQQLAADVELWLADEPVTVYREPFRVRVRRWRRKHRPLVAALSAACLVVLVAAGAFGWWYQQEQTHQANQKAAREQEQAQRAAQLERETNDMVERVERLRGEARTAPVGDLQKWTEALALAKQAEGRLGSAVVDDRVKRRVTALVAALEQEHRDHSMVFQVDEARLLLADFDAGEARYQAAADAFARAFREHGIDVETSPGVAAAQIQKSRIKDQLVEALDWWNLAQRGTKKPDKDGRHLVQMARRVDPDQLRNLIRDLWTNEGPREEVHRKLKNLASREEVLDRPASDLILIGLIFADSPFALDLMEKTQQHYPDNFWINFHLGELFYHKKPAGLGQAIRYWTTAVALRSQNPMIHRALGNALYRKGDLDGAVSAYRHSFRLNKNNPASRQAFSSFLSGQGEALFKKGDLDGAITVFREAIEMSKDKDLAYSLLGIALGEKGDLAGATTSLRQAIYLNKTDPEPLGNLGQVQLRQGRFADAVVTLQQAVELAAQNPQSSQEFKNALKRKLELCKEFLATDKQLRSILSGEKKVTAALDQLFLAELCRYKRLYGTSAGFYDKAFQAQPDLANDLVLQDRYHAACVAALAGSGQGEDAAKVDVQTRVHWRKQAVQWLQADLTLYAKKLDTGDARDRVMVQTMLRHSQQVLSLAGIRDPAQLANLPAPERAAYAKFWADVAALLEKTRVLP